MNNATTDTKASETMNADVHALVRSLKHGNYGTHFSHLVYAEAERRGLIVYVDGEGFRAA
jgi:hypothetical protein